MAKAKENGKKHEEQAEVNAQPEVQQMDMDTLQKLVEGNADLRELWTKSVQRITRAAERKQAEAGLEKAGTLAESVIKEVIDSLAETEELKSEELKGIEVRITVHAGPELRVEHSVRKPGIRSGSGTGERGPLTPRSHRSVPEGTEFQIRKGGKLSFQVLERGEFKDGRYELNSPLKDGSKSFTKQSPLCVAVYKEHGFGETCGRHPLFIRLPGSSDFIRADGGSN